MRAFLRFLALAANDFKSRYAGNSLGAAWAFAYPCITVLIYWFVFRAALKTGGSGDVPYILWLVSALVPYMFVSESVSGSASVMLDYSFLVKKARFDWRVLPAVRVVSYTFIHLFFAALLLALSVFFGFSLKTGDLWLIYFLLAELIFTAAVSYIMSAAAVFFRDIRNALGVLFQLGFWLTPIFWDISSLSPRLGLAVKIISPVTYITEGIRQTVLCGSPFGLGAAYTAYFWLLTLALGACAALLFSRLKGSLADYL